MKNTDTKTAFQLKINNNSLTFRTSSFKAEKTSVLHSGVYTREFSSMLFASAACVLFYLMTGLIHSKTPLMRYFILVTLFVITFLGANRYIFNERYLEAFFDRTAKTITIERSGLIIKRKEKIPFSNLTSVEIDTKKYTPVNVDGIDFVQKISAQHGSPVPGLSEAEEFVTLVLRLNDGTDRVIYAAKIDGGKVDGEPEIPLGEIKNFLNM